MGALAWAGANLIGGMLGVTVVFGAALALSALLSLVSRRRPVNAGNVTGRLASAMRERAA
ncbi:hypothetical protein [Streptosporangium sp. NPDC002607]